MADKEEQANEPNPEIEALKESVAKLVTAQEELEKSVAKLQKDLKDLAKDIIDANAAAKDANQSIFNEQVASTKRMAEIEQSLLGLLKLCGKQGKDTQEIVDLLGKQLGGAFTEQAKRLLAE